MSGFRNWVESHRESQEEHVQRLENLVNPLNEKCENLQAEWNNSAKPAGFWKHPQTMQIYEYREQNPCYYTMGMDRSTGQNVPANSIESVIYLTKKFNNKL